MKSKGLIRDSIVSKIYDLEYFELKKIEFELNKILKNRNNER